MKTVLFQERSKEPEATRPDRHNPGVRILLVEDDRALAQAVEEALTAGHHDVRLAVDGAGALDAVGYDLVLLDLALPDMDGRDVCRTLRSLRPDLPIIIVSASGTEVDRVLGFELGADDYLVKPFSVRELLARIRALAKRAGLDHRSDVAQAIGPHVRLDRRSRQAFLDGAEVHLTSKEFDILSFLCEDVGAARRRSEIIEHVWGGQWFGPTKTLDAHVAALRRKLDGGVVITALRGVGFRVDPAE
jgi:two-component system response regulator RegX3